MLSGVLGVWVSSPPSPCQVWAVTPYFQALILCPLLGLLSRWSRTREEADPSVSSTAPTTDAGALPGPRILVWNDPEYLPGAFSLQCSPPPSKAPTGRRVLPGLLRGLWDRPTCPVLSWGCGAAVTAMGVPAARFQRPALQWATPSLGVSRGEAVV